MEGGGLSEEEWRLLQGYSKDEQGQEADLLMLAKLERLGLLMRGWNDTHVVTARGHEWLKERASRG